MSGVGRKKNKDSGIGDEGSDAVEELLHAAEDDILLSISIDSHAARCNHLEADLARRLQALKIPSSSPNITKKPLPPMQQIPPVVVDDELKMILGADLSSRFAALKASSSSSSTFSSSKQVQGLSWKFEDDTGDDDVDDGGVPKKEVDKVIQWAMDAARLDPSPASDDEDELDSDDDELDSDDEDKDERKKLKKGEIKKKKDQRDECRTHKANDM